MSVLPSLCSQSSAMLPQRTADLGRCRIGTDWLEHANERRGQLLQRQTSTVPTEVGDRRLDDGADALFAHQFGQPHHHVGIGDLLPNPDATGALALPRLSNLA